MRLALLIALVGCTPPASDGPDSDSGTGPTGTPTTGSPQPLGSDASLASLEVVGAAMTPAFSPGRSLYAVPVQDGLEVRATPADPIATVALVVEAFVGGQELRRLGAEDPVDLVGGERLIVEVTSADGSQRSRTQLSGVPPDFPTLDVWSDSPSPGFLFLAPMSFSDPPPGVGRYLMIVDNEGVPLWLRRSDTGLAFDFKPGPGGALTWIVYDRDAYSDRYGVQLDPDGTLHSPLRADGQVIDHHEHTLLPNGNRLMLGLSQEPQDLSPWGGAADQLVYDQVASEVDPDGNVVFSWSTRGNVPPDHVLDTSIWQNTPIADLAHSNALTVDPHDGNWLISLRNPCAVMKIDRTTGQRLWTLGGVGSDFTFVDDDRLAGWQGFAYQHSPIATGPDRIAVLDNSLAPWLPNNTSGTARYVEYQLDTTQMTATVVDQWVLEGAGYIDAAGSVQRLADGSTLLGWGNEATIGADRAPAVVELDPTGQVQLELRLPELEWSYRVFKYELDASGEWVLDQ